MIYKNKRFFENWNVFQPKTTGKYDIPILKESNSECTEFIGFNEVNKVRNTKRGVHFYLDDYQIDRVWRCPERYIDRLKQFKAVMTPDFSIYGDLPKAMQIYNHYRRMWCGAFWQFIGIEVIPCVCWGDSETYDLCFSGYQKGGVVSVSSVGTQRRAEDKESFLQGYNEMIKRLEPKKILFYGKVPNECRGNIYRLSAFQERFDKIGR